MSNQQEELIYFVEIPSNVSKIEVDSLIQMLEETGKLKVYVSGQRGGVETLQTILEVVGYTAGILAGINKSLDEGEKILKRVAKIWQKSGNKKNKEEVLLIPAASPDEQKKLGDIEEE